MADNWEVVLQCMQRESYNFLEYRHRSMFVQRIADVYRYTRTKVTELGYHDSDGKALITFGDIVPPAETTKFVAAQVKHVRGERDAADLAGIFSCAPVGYSRCFACRAGRSLRSHHDFESDRKHMRGPHYDKAEYISVDSEDSTMLMYRQYSRTFRNYPCETRIS